MWYAYFGEININKNGDENAATKIKISKFIPVKFSILAKYCVCLLFLFFLIYKIIHSMSALNSAMTMI